LVGIVVTIGGSLQDPVFSNLQTPAGRAQAPAGSLEIDQTGMRLHPNAVDCPPAQAGNSPLAPPQPLALPHAKGT
jgi:hypothetical protein